jgi:tetracycline resistance efflux pump
LPHDYAAWSLLPPLMAIVLAIGTRQVFVSLASGIWIGYVLIERSVMTGTTAALQAAVSVFDDADNTRVILFSLLVGSLIALVQRSGGVQALVNAAGRRGLLADRKRAGLLTMAVGACIFVESNMSCLVTGAIGRPIFDRLRMSREKLAYVCDSCSAPVCILMPLNGWGAYILAQLTMLGVEDPVPLLVASLPLNFYAILTLTLLLISLARDIDFGPMHQAQQRVLLTGQIHRAGATPLVADEVIALDADSQTPRRTINFALPVIVMIASLPVGLAYTGIANLPADRELSLWNVLRSCSGSTSVYWAVFAAVMFAWLLYRSQGIMKLPELVSVSLKGAAGMLPLALLMVLAFAIGELCSDEGLSTGSYVASLVGEDVSQSVVVPLLFMIASGIAFSTGTSWGTFAIMLAIAMPLSVQLELNQPLVVAAVLGGGVFGDHCSPISDTTVVSSMAGATDHIEHVRTQLPYALVAGAAALVFYLLAGLIV